MAVAFDGVNSAQAVGASTLSVSITTSGANRYLLANAGVSSGTGAPTYTSLTYNGVSMGTPLVNQTSTANLRQVVSGLVAPASGANTLAITWSGAGDELALGGCSFTGVDQSTPIGTPGTATGTQAASITVNASSAAGEIVIDALYVGGSGAVAPNTTIAVGAGQTSRWEQESIGAYSAGGQSTEPGGATVTMSWTASATTYDWALFAVGVKPAAAGGLVVNPLSGRGGTLAHPLVH